MRVWLEVVIDLEICANGVIAVSQIDCEIRTRMVFRHLASQALFWRITVKRVRGYRTIRPFKISGIL